MIAVDTVQVIPIASLEAHPDNPRLIVKEEVLSALVESIKTRGFDAAYALLVRPLGGKYQIVSGHTRRMAAEQAGVSDVPCWVRDMSDEEAFLELVRVNNHGELAPLEIGMHALRAVDLGVGGAGNEGGLRGYAKMLSKPVSGISQNRSAAEVFTRVNGFNVVDCLDKTRHLCHVSRAPESDWQWLVGLLLEDDWSVKQTEAAVAAVLQLGEVPEILASWLNPDSYKTKAALEATSDKDGKSPTAHSVAMWVKAANEELETFPKMCQIWRIEDDVPKLEKLELHSLFVERLRSVPGVPSAKRIQECAQRLHNELTELDEAYQRWQDSRKDAEAKAKAEAAAAAELRERKIRFSPVGINGDIREVDLSEYGLFDAIITDPPYLLSNGGITIRGQHAGASVDKNFEDTRGVAVAPKEWLSLVDKVLRPGGVLVATCSLHILWELSDEARALGYDVEKDLCVWHKPSAPPQLVPDRHQANFEFIFIAHKQGGESVFNYDEYRRMWGSQPARVYTIQQCSGNERLGWHDTQKPIDLAERLVLLYVPKDGLMLDPFAGTGTFSAAAKMLGRRSVWVEKDPDFFTRTETRLGTTPYEWETKK